MEMEKAKKKWRQFAGEEGWVQVMIENFQASCWYLSAGQLSFDCWHNRIIELNAADLIIDA